MEPNSREDRWKLFRQELFILRDEGYLSETIVEKVAEVHQQYQLDLLKAEKAQQLSIDSQFEKPTPAKTQKVRKIPTPEEIRERNITWSLIIGVIFLLIGGLFVATSNWESLTSLMKSGLIALVALLFYGIAFLTTKVLHIDKTAFAFTILGSLFLPILILSLGWFGLLGSYLSIDGEGRYLLGMMGSFLPIIVYFLFANKLKSRLFVWFCYVSLSTGAAFLLASLKLSIDVFYLGMAVFNALLILVYRKMKDSVPLKLFTKEFVPYIQVNLILSTFFMLVIYDNEVFYSINLLLTAIIYLSMIYVSGRKEYHFIFTLMLVYGAYQLIEHSFLDNFGGIIYALVAFGILFVPQVASDKFNLDKVFQNTSAVVSGLAFVYITLEGILLREGNPSLVLLIAYLIITGNFMYLGERSSRTIFPYLSAIFAASAIYEAIALLTLPVHMINLSLRIFITGFILFTAIGIVQLAKWVKVIQTAAKHIGLGIMMLAILLAFISLFWWELGVMLLLLSVAAYLMCKVEFKNILIKEISSWSMPLSLGLSMVVFGQEIITKSNTFYLVYGYAINFAVGAAIVLLSSLIWRRRNECGLARTSLYISEALYTLAILYALLSPINQAWIQPLVLAIGIGMYYYLYKVEKAKWIPFFVSITVLFCYFSILDALLMIYPFNPLVESLITPVSGVLLLLIAAFCRKKDSYLTTAFAWVGHIILPLALAFTLFTFYTNAIYSFIIASAVYGLSTRLAVKEWMIKAFLNGSFTSVFFIVLSGLDMAFVQKNGRYEFPITSSLLLIFVLLSNDEFKRRTALYLVPFSVFGIGCMLLSYPFGWLPYLVTGIYTLGVLIYLHNCKWDAGNIVPLFLFFLATAEYSLFNGLDALEKTLLFGFLGMILIIIGQIVYKKLFDGYKRKFSEVSIDGYTIISFLYFSSMYLFANQQIWGHVLPGILIATSLWLQRKRVPENFSVFMSLIGGCYLLQPYFSIVTELNVPPLWDKEVLVFPFIILEIFIRKSFKGRYAIITRAIQWGVLIIASLILIQDGMASHTIYDAIILGSLSLLSMISGMVLQNKAYFFVGAGMVLLNVLLQTKPYWGHMPWWVYLLTAGLILITIASFNEWHKQKTQKGEATFLTILKEKVIDKIRRWE